MLIRNFGWEVLGSLEEQSHFQVIFIGDSGFSVNCRLIKQSTSRVSGDSYPIMIWFILSSAAHMTKNQQTSSASSAVHPSGWQVLVAPRIRILQIMPSWVLSLFSISHRRCHHQVKNCSSKCSGPLLPPSRSLRRMSLPKTCFDLHARNWLLIESILSSIQG